MYTSVAVLALAATSAVTTASGTASVKWQEDYTAAGRLGKEEGKPLAVFVGTGARGWEKVSVDEKFSPAINKLLAEHYVCVYLDKNTPRARRLADAFRMADGVGLVLSTRDGEGQAFRHVGPLALADLEDGLRKYANRRLTVVETERGNSVEARAASYYAPAAPPTPAYAPPAPAYFPTFPGGFGPGVGGFGGGAGRC